eukprot:COSAG02_NODE_145_length_34010_cov_7.359696_11_plen_53_part_00
MDSILISNDSYDFDVFTGLLHHHVVAQKISTEDRVIRYEYTPALPVSGKFTE